MMMVMMMTMLEQKTSERMPTNTVVRVNDESVCRIQLHVCSMEEATKYSLRRLCEDALRQMPKSVSLHQLVDWHLRRRRAASGWRGNEGREKEGDGEGAEKQQHRTGDRWTRVDGWWVIRSALLQR